MAEESASGACSTARGLIDSVDTTLGLGRKPNHVGSFYRVVIDRLEEVIATAGKAPRPLPDLTPWVPAMGKIMAEGEKGHCVFFKDLFTGVHAGFNGHPDIWSLAPTDSAYPAWQVAVYVGHPRQIEDPVALSLAWLSNLHYWLVLSFLSHSYRYGDEAFDDLARQHMLGPMWSLGRQLPKLGAGLPFDPLSMGYNWGNDALGALSFYEDMLVEVTNLVELLGPILPTDYPLFVTEDTFAEIRAMARAGTPL